MTSLRYCEECAAYHYGAEKCYPIWYVVAYSDGWKAKEAPPTVREVRPLIEEWTRDGSVEQIRAVDADEAIERYVEGSDESHEYIDVTTIFVVWGNTEPIGVYTIFGEPSVAWRVEKVDPPEEGSLCPTE